MKGFRVLVVLVILLSLMTLACIGSGSGSGDVSGGLAGPQATATSAAHEWHVQLTAMAQESAAR